MDQAAVRTRGVDKRFGRHTAVSQFDLTVPQGTIYGLLGPNGSGKTTMIRMIMGILLPDAGTIELFGAPPDFERRSRVGYLPEERGVYEKMKVLDQLVFLGEIRGVARPIARDRALEWLERLGIDAWGKRNPDLLILDEPFSGLDPINQELLEGIVRAERDRGKTVLFSTHLMEQAERLCERVCLISRSRKVLDGELRELKRAERSGAVALDFQGSRDWLEHRGIERVSPTPEGVEVFLGAGYAAADLLAAAIEAGVTLRRFELLEPSLHEIFVRHAGHAPDAPAPSLSGGAA